LRKFTTTTTSSSAAASFVELEFVPGFEPRSVFDSEDPRIDSSSFLEPVPEPGLEPGPVFGIEAPKQVRSVARIAGLTAK